jgi:hypothetical protein
MAAPFSVFFLSITTNQRDLPRIRYGNPSVMGGLFIRKTPSFMGSTWLGCLSACPSSSILCQAPLVPFGYFPAVFA